MHVMTIAVLFSFAQFSRALSTSNCEDWNLDLSGRFSDGGGVLPSKLVHVYTQTSVTDAEIPSWPAVDRATSTEGLLSHVRLNDLYLVS